MMRRKHPPENGGVGERLIAGTVTLLQKQSGVVAIEFAVVGSVFLLMVLFVMSLGLQQFTQSTMDAATQIAARQIQIGTLRGTSSDVTSLICKRLSSVAPNCTGTLQVYAFSGSSFTPMARVSSPSTGLSSQQFSPGGSSSYVLLQVAYLTSPMVPFPGYKNSYLISSVAFQNEP